MSGFKVLQPGLLTLIQDSGRMGHHRIGLTNGGPLDDTAFNWANRLLGNDANATALEVSIGGLVLEAQCDTYVVLTGAAMPLKINGTEQEGWCAHKVQAGDRIDIGFSTAGARAYLTVSGGFNIAKSFDSTATVTRESLGGLNGEKLQQDDFLPCEPATDQQVYRLPEAFRPDYTGEVALRVVVGYQQAAFSDVQKRLFFSSEYTVSNNADRMGYRLTGQEITGPKGGMLSEGICHGAIQIPADGQPIVLLNDRQTIGGYPKIGSVIAMDTARLTQLLPGASVSFEEVSIDEAHALRNLAQARFNRAEPEAL